MLLDAIERAVGLDQGDSLLDLACGTGEVSLALADRLADIWAIDLEPEMVAVARQNALDRGIHRIRWLVGRAEDATLPEDHFALIAVGRAFHRLNRPLIAQRGTRWLRSRGFFVDLGADSAGLFEPSEPWMVAAAEVYERWLPRAHKSLGDVTSGSGPDQPKATTQAVLAEAGFTQIEKCQFRVPHVWEIDQFLGYLCSTSYSSQDFWGGSLDRLPAGPPEHVGGAYIHGSVDGDDQRLLRGGPQEVGRVRQAPAATARSGWSCAVPAVWR